MKRTIILIGAKPNNDANQHPGGQMTASLGLITYVEQHTDYDIEVIDTSQVSYPVPSLFSRLAKSLGRFIKLIRVLKRKNTVGCIIFSSSGFSFYEKSLMAWVCSRRRVYSVFFMRSGHFVNEVRASGFRRKFISYLLTFPNLIGVQGEYWRAFFADLSVPDASILTVRNWLSPSFEIADTGACLEDDAVLSFIYVGALTSKKGIKELLLATKMLRDEGYMFSLTMIGGGDLEGECSDYLSEYGLGGIVKLTGWQSQQFVAESLEASDVFVFPSKAEGFPNSILEALAYGLPVIANDVGAISDSVVDGVNGVLMTEGDAAEIVHAMQGYIKIPRTVNEHSVNAIKLVHDNHNYLDNCARLISAIESET